MGVSTQDILFEIKNRLGVITLNRPKALNALSLDMFIALSEQLVAWKEDPTIKAVLIRSNNEKAFCAGGDIRAIYENKEKHLSPAADYFKLEYAINQLIFHYPKPYIALIHGITMGGGVGISTHGSHCISSEALRWAMPETMIGFFPDVGASYYLSRLPFSIGTYLALTGNTINAADALHLKLIHTIVHFDQFDAIEKKLMESNFDVNDFNTVTTILESFSQVHKHTHQLHPEKIAACFGFSTVEAIIHALEKDNSLWAQETLGLLLQRSPTSLKVALHQLHLARHKSFDEVIAMDLHIAQTMLRHHDFYEGIRAAIIDKDKNPQWNPARVEQVSEGMVKRRYFSN